MHICTHAQTRIIIRHQHVSVTAVTIISVSYNENTVNTQRVVKMYDKIIKYATKSMIKPLNMIQKCMIKPRVLSNIFLQLFAY